MDTNNNGLPLVTVAMITYNSSKYVAAGIESILCQSYKNFELLICDDCSPDNTWEIISKYNDPRIKATKNEKNLGENGNRNKVISLAKGEYFIFIDGDDMMYPHGLEFMTKMLYAFPECGMALMYWFKNNMFWPIVITPRHFYIGEYFGNGFLGTAFSNVLFKTTILREEGGISKKYLSADDDYIRYKIAIKHNSLVIGDNLTWWRESPDQAYQKHSKSGLAFIDIVKLKIEMLENPSCPFNEKEKSEAKENVYRMCYKEIMRLLLTLKWRIAIRLFTSIKPPLKYIITIIKAPVFRDHFPDHNPKNPVMLPFERNPYSASFRDINNTYVNE